MDGAVVRLGGKHLDAGGYDLMGVITVGSEGLLGVVITEVTVRILRKAPETAMRAMLIGFPLQRGGRRLTVGRHHRRRHYPRRPGDDGPAGNSRRRGTSFTRAIPATWRRLLIAELDGPFAEVEHLIARVDVDRPGHRRASVIRISRTDDAERVSGSGPAERTAFPAVGRISPDYYCMDGTIPRASSGRGAEPDGPDVGPA